MQYHQPRRILALVTAALIVVSPAGAFADKGSDLQSELDQAKRRAQDFSEKIAAVKAEQEALVAQIADVNAEISAISNSVLQLKNALAQKNQEKERAQKRLAEITLEIERTAKEIREAKARLAAAKKVLNVRIKRIYMMGEFSYTAVLLSSVDFADFINRVAFLLRIQAQDNRLVQQVAAAKAAVEEEQRRLEEAKTVAKATEEAIAADVRRMQQLEMEEETRLASLQAAKSEKESLADRLNQSQAALVAQVQQEQAKANAVGEELEAWNAEVARAAAAAARALQEQAYQAPTASMKGRLGVDYSFARPSPEAIRANGYAFVARYLSPYGEKNITPNELAGLRANGLAVVLVWESDSDRALAGYGAGVEDAYQANDQAWRLGAPDSAPIYFAVDFDASSNHMPAINDYLRGVASVIGQSRVGVYGGYNVIESAFDNGTATFGWQALAWSYGRIESRAHIYQDGRFVFDGKAGIDIALQDYIGQWY